jgi:hypothetical protein
MIQFKELLPVTLFIFSLAIVGLVIGLAWLQNNKKPEDEVRAVEGSLKSIEKELKENFRTLVICPRCEKTMMCDGLLCHRKKGDITAAAQNTAGQVEYVYRPYFGRVRRTNNL